MDKIGIPSAELLATIPCPVFYTEVDRLMDDPRPTFDELEFMMGLPMVGGAHLLSCEHRAVSLDRLPRILEAGIDVEPSDSPIFAGPFDKAWEYGGAPKVIQVLDPECLERSWCEVAPGTSKETIDVIRARFPNLVTLPYDGTMLFSKLPPDDPRMGSPYEIAYGYCVVGDPLRALKAIVVVADRSAPMREDVLALLSLRMRPT